MTKPISDAPADTPVGYSGWHARAKHNWLLATLVSASEYDPVDRPDLAMASPLTMASVAAFPTTLARTLERTQDVMEPERPKIIHAQGAVAMVEFVTDKASHFTGVLAPPPAGGAIGLVRLSLAVPPKGKGSITPGMGLKLLVDGEPSLDLLAMNHTVGQGRDFNLFSNTFTHDLRNEHEELRPPQKLMSWFFKRVTAQPRRLTIDHLAAIQSDGTQVADPIVPTRLVLHPHRDVRRSVYAGAHGEDFRDPLLRIEPGTNLWTVRAVGTGQGDTAHGDTGQGGTAQGDTDLAIATIRTTSRFCCSLGGDRLFFRHHVAAEDRIKN